MIDFNWSGFFLTVWHILTYHIEHWLLGQSRYWEFYTKLQVGCPLVQWWSIFGKLSGRCFVPIQVVFIANNSIDCHCRRGSYDGAWFTCLTNFISSQQRFEWIANKYLRGSERERKSEDFCDSYSVWRWPFFFWENACGIME